MNRSWVLLLVPLVGCDRPITSTFVDGTVNGVSLPAANAVSATDIDVLGGKRETVWLAPNLRCSDLGRSTTMLDFGPSTLQSPDGGHLPLLILSTGPNAVFDTGDGGERLRATEATFQADRDESDKLKGRFSARFGDGGTFSGDFIASRCENANPGCGATSALLPMLGLLWLARRRRS